MKKELERYFLVEYIGNVCRIYKTEEEYNNFIKIIKSYNRKTNYSKLFGNVITIPHDGIVEVHVSVFNKLSPRRTLRNIDLEMYKRPDFKAITKVYSDKIKYSNPDIYIAYFETENSDTRTMLDPNFRIKGLPLLIHNEQRYLNDRFIKERIEHYSDCKDLVFFSRLCNELCFNKNSLDDLVKLRESINSVEYACGNEFILAIDGYNLYRSYVKEKDSHGNVLKDEDGEVIISHRRVRDVGTFIMNYDLEKAKMSPRIINTTQYNVEHGEPIKNCNVQMMIKSY